MPPSWREVGRFLWDAVVTEPDPNDPVEKLKRAWEKVEDADAALRIYNAVLSLSDSPEEKEKYDAGHGQEDREGGR